jgi:hypothetical protein
LLPEASSNHSRYTNPPNSKMQAVSPNVSMNLRTANFPLGNRKDSLALAAKLNSAGEHDSAQFSTTIRSRGARWL